jgi:hypothetical protein
MARAFKVLMANSHLGAVLTKFTRDVDLRRCNTRQCGRQGKLDSSRTKS